MKLRYDITGLDCPNCAAKLASQMSSLPGVENAKINFLTEKLTVEATADEDAIFASLTKCAKAFSKDIVIEK